MLNLRESSKTKMLKDLLLSATTGTPCMVAMAAVVKDAVDEGLRVALKGQQLAEAVALLRKHAQVRCTFTIQAGFWL